MNFYFNSYRLVFKVTECSTFKTNMDNFWSLQLLFEVHTGILGKNDLIALTGGTDYMLEFLSLSYDFVHLSNIVLIVASCLGY